MHDDEDDRCEDMLTALVDGRVAIQFPADEMTLFFSPASAREMAFSLWRLAREAEAGEREAAQQWKEIGTDLGGEA